MRLPEPSALGPVVVLAPDGRDAAEIARVLDAMGVASEPTAGVAALRGKLRADGGAATAALLVAEEALADGADALVACLAGQPPWSDLPVLVLTADGLHRDDEERWALFGRLGNVSLVDRRSCAATLRSVVRAALRARARQHEMRRHLEALRHATETLEARVGERTKELRANEARLRAIFETSYQFQKLLALDGALLDANATSLEGIGATLADVVGKPYWDTPWFAATPGLASRVRDAVAVAADGGTVREEITADLPTGRRSFDFSMRPMRDEGGRAAAILTEAVETTERRLAEEALRQAQKMEAVGQLTGGVAHDFNNLLTVVIGNLALLQRRLAHEPALLRLVESALSAGQRGAQLTQQLLAFARRQPLQAVDLDLNETVRGIGDLLQRTVGSAVAFEIAVGDEALPVRVDRNQLEMAVLNLVVNARDASPAGGRVVVATSRLPATPAAASGSQVSLSVRDEGTGMTPEVLGRAFEPFFTTKPAGIGTGLGLSMVYGFVRQSGGDVDIRSAPGRGTLVRLRFPEGIPAAAEPEGPTEEVRPSQGERVLVVEDDPGVRAVAVTALGQLGYPVCEAEDGEAALRLLREVPDIDLLFTDVVMPGPMDGIALARAARRIRPDLRVLVTSGRLPDGASLDGVLGPRGAFLGKPYQLVELALAVQAMLDSGR